MTPSLNCGGGEELSTLNIARELKSRGHEAIFMSSGGPLEAQLKRHNIRFEKANIRGRGIIGIIKGAAEVRRFLKKEKISIIHAQTPWPALMARLAQVFLLKKAPVIWHDRGIRKSNYKFVARLANIFFDRVVSNSNDEENLLLQAGLKKSKSIMVHNGLMLEDYLVPPGQTNSRIRAELGLNDDSVLIGMIGRLHPEKGPKWLIAAANILRDRNIHFIFAGDGPQRKEIEALISRSGLTDRVHLLGFRDDIANILDQLDVLVIPSESESFGNVALEAMLMGVPVVAANVGGLKEIISDGIDGIFVEPKNPDMIAQNIVKLIENEELRKSISSRGKQKVVSYFNIKRVVDEIEQVYEGLIK